MQRRTHASIGAWTLGPAPPVQAWGDAFRSIELVGQSTLERAVRAQADTATLLREPIDAARAWLADPAHRAALAPAVLHGAEATLDVADAHLRELDLLAGQVAHDANESGIVDDSRLQQLDAMAATMRAYAGRLRQLLDPAGVPPDADGRLRAALDAAAQGGGLRGLVAAL